MSAEPGAPAGRSPAAGEEGGPEPVLGGIDSVSQTLMARMLRRRVFVAISTPVEGGPDIRLHLAEHLRHQIGLEKTGALAAAGPFVDADADGPPQGMFIVRAASREEARRILDADPLHAHGVRTYALYEWQVNEGRVGITVDFSDQGYDIT